MLTLPWLVAYLRAKLHVEVCENEGISTFPFQFADSLNSIQDSTGGPWTSLFKPAFQPPSGTAGSLKQSILALGIQL